MTVVGVRVLQAMPARCCDKCGGGGKVKPLRLGLNLLWFSGRGKKQSSYCIQAEFLF
jgi:hypothetical protein